MGDTEIVLFDPERHQDLLPDIVELHVRCVEFDSTLLRFHPPFTNEKRLKMLAFWTERLQQVSRGLRVCFLSMSKSRNGVSGDTASPRQTLSGMVELGMPEAETGPFRADVEMLMVSPDHRRKGLANKLMFALEKLARERERTLLLLATTTGSPAANFVYPKLGYIKFGTVPNYGITPKSGEIVAGEYFYKDLTRLVEDQPNLR